MVSAACRACSSRRRLSFDLRPVVPGFLGHLFHFLELLTGTWASHYIVASYLEDMPDQAAREAVRHIFAPFMSKATWYSTFQPSFVEPLLPRAEILDSQAWSGANVTSTGGRPRWLRFQRVVVADHLESMQAPLNQLFNKQCGVITRLAQQVAPRAFLAMREPILAAFAAAAATNTSDAARWINATRAGRGGVIDPESSAKPPVLTYISRQRTGRRFSNNASDAMGDLLQQLHASGDWRVQSVFMEDLPYAEQVVVASQSNVLSGRARRLSICGARTQQSSPLCF